MDFYSGKQLLEQCQKQGLPISEVMKLREIITGEQSEEKTMEKLRTALAIMKQSATKPIKTPGKSIGGLIGG